jgi:hypothetical protein
VPDQPTPSKNRDNQKTEQMRITYAFWLAVIGLALAAALVVFLVNGGSYKAATSTDIVAIVGLFTSVLGTLVGAFFGLQIGSAGKEKAQQNEKDATNLAHKALAALQPEQAQRIVASL